MFTEAELRLLLLHSAFFACNAMGADLQDKHMVDRIQEEIRLLNKGSQFYADADYKRR